MKYSMKLHTNSPQSQWLSCLGTCTQRGGVAEGQEEVEGDADATPFCCRACLANRSATPIYTSIQKLVL